MKEVDKIAWIEVRNGQILCAKSRNKNKYYIPGGKRELNETDQETLIREIKEELNVRIDESTIEYFGTFRAQSDGAKAGVMVKMTCYRASYKGKLRPSNEIEEIRWLKSEDEHIISEVDKLIFSLLKENGEIE